MDAPYPAPSPHSNSSNNKHLNPRELAIEELPAGLGAARPVSIGELTSVLRAGNEARRRNNITADGHQAGREIPAVAAAAAAAVGGPARLMSERLELAGLRLSPEGITSRTLEAGRDGGGMYEEDVGSGDDGDSTRAVVDFAMGHDQSVCRGSRPGGETPAGVAIDPPRAVAHICRTVVSSDARNTARAATTQRLRVGRPHRRQHLGLIPSRGALDRMDRQIDEVERQWGRVAVTTQARMPTIAEDSRLLKGSRSASQRQYLAYSPDARASMHIGEGAGSQVGNGAVRKPCAVSSEQLTEDRSSVSTFPLCVPRLEHTHQGTPAGGGMATMEDEGEAVNNMSTPVPTVLIPGKAAFPAPPMPDLGLATTEPNNPDATVSLGSGYTDDNHSLFFPPSAARRRARANALSIPAVPGGMTGHPDGESSEETTSSMSQVPSVFDVRIPTPPPRTAEPVPSDRVKILPTFKQRRIQQTRSGGDGDGGGGSNPSGLRRNRRRPAPAGLRPTVRRAPPSAVGLELNADALDARGGVVAGSPVPAALAPGHTAVPRAPPPVHLAPGRYDGEDWPSPQYGEYGFAPGDDWKARWMSYEGSYR
ncbi:hypothetical protein VPNG_07640 [Cytospora leucostoma]|uniref:Uncharacterized protein n=1 Tax=Cytospora leucostoma TaxID=1230097 RepID=A0A423WFV1_9PEZI|nr:hypothetical protein VPNG_07640 [Cytospora leucostoma]